MRTFLKVAAVALATVTAVPASLEHAHGQGASPFEGSRITHVGVIVRDPSSVGKLYGEVFGVTVAEPVDFKGKIDFPKEFRGDRDSYPRYTRAMLSNLAIEIMAPVGGASPWREYLDKYGEGLHHICFGVRDLNQAIAHLQTLGGVLEFGGSRGVGYAYVNFREQLGFTI